MRVTNWYRLGTTIMITMTVVIIAVTMNTTKVADKGINNFTDTTVIASEIKIDAVITKPQMQVNPNRELLAHLISSESRDQGFEGMCAVGTIVMNRMNHSNKRLFGGNNMKSVIYQPYQFSCINDNNWHVKITAEAYKAADKVLSGHRTFGKRFVYYANVAQATNKQFIAEMNGHESIKIGDHSFYAYEGR